MCVSLFSHIEPTGYRLPGFPLSKWMVYTYPVYPILMLFNEFSQYSRIFIHEHGVYCYSHLGLEIDI